MSRAILSSELNGLWRFGHCESAVGEPPNDLVPQTVRVGFLVPKAEGGKRVLRAVIDPNNEVIEITKSNNTVSASF